MGFLYEVPVIGTTRMNAEGGNLLQELCDGLWLLRQEAVFSVTNRPMTHSFVAEPGFVASLPLNSRTA